jgi:hypothetical protein
MTQIPPSIIGTIAPLLDAQYTHSQLNALFMHAGFPGNPPEGNKSKNVSCGFAEEMQSALILCGCSAC